METRLKLLLGIALNFFGHSLLFSPSDEAETKAINTASSFQLLECNNQCYFHGVTSPSLLWNSNAKGNVSDSVWVVPLVQCCTFACSSWPLVHFQCSEEANTAAPICSYPVANYHNDIPWVTLHRFAMWIDAVSAFLVLLLACFVVTS